jgi:CheY-like chemotaxis protein
MARVLVVDDDPDVLNLVAFRLRKAQHKVIAVGGGEQALDVVAERGAPDVAVLDVMMPGLDGLTLLQRLRALEGLEQLPAIFLSARVQPEDIEVGRALGATYLTKPFVATALLNAIEAALNAREAEVDGW